MMMRKLFLLTFAVSACLLVAAKDTHKVSKVSKLPKGLSKKVAAVLDPNGHKIAGLDGPLLEIWLVKDVAVIPDFKPSFTVKYPFKPGQLIGALRVPEKSKFTDFRGQEIKPGVYTLRYGQQPEDGNHIGTSDLADFMLSIPAKADADPKTIGDFDTLAQMSAKSAGATHPAIFSLLPTEKKAPKTAVIKHDEDKGFWILQLTGSGKAKGKKVAVPIRMVAVGVSEG